MTLLWVGGGSMSILITNTSLRNQSPINQMWKTFEQTILLLQLRGQTQCSQTRGAVASKGLVTGDTMICWWQMTSILSLHLISTLLESSWDPSFANKEPKVQGHTASQQPAVECQLHFWALSWISLNHALPGPSPIFIQSLYHAPHSSPRPPMLSGFCPICNEKRAGLQKPPIAPTQKAWLSILANVQLQTRSPTLRGS